MEKTLKALPDALRPGNLVSIALLGVNKVVHAIAPPGLHAVVRRFFGGSTREYMAVMLLFAMILSAGVCVLLFGYGAKFTLVAVRALAWAHCGGTGLVCDGILSTGVAALGAVDGYSCEAHVYSYFQTAGALSVRDRWMNVCVEPHDLLMHTGYVSSAHDAAFRCCAHDLRLWRWALTLNRDHNTYGLAGTIVLVVCMLLWSLVVSCWSLGKSLLGRRRRRRNAAATAARHRNSVVMTPVTPTLHQLRRVHMQRSSVPMTPVPSRRKLKF